MSKLVTTLRFVLTLVFAALGGYTGAMAAEMLIGPAGILIVVSASCIWLSFAINSSKKEVTK